MCRRRVRGNVLKNNFRHCEPRSGEAISNEIPCSLILSEIASSGYALLAMTGLNKLDAPRRKRDHAEQQQTMLPTGDVCRAIRSFAVTDGEVNDLQV